MGREYAYEPIGLASRRRQRSHVAVGLGVFALVVFVLASKRRALTTRATPAETPNPQHGPWQQSGDGDAAPALDAPRNVRLKTAYGRPPSLESYGLDLVAEPRADNFLAWEGDRAGIAWAAAGAANASVWASGDGDWRCSCRTAGASFALTYALGAASATYSVACKFVRRELRALTADDRAAWFEALAVLARADDGEALRERYGGRAVTLGELAEKHAHGPGCSPFHGGVSFFTAHAAFTRQLDAALRAVAPSLRVATPYWDFTLDGEAYGEAPYGWDRSSIFGDDAFGSCRATGGLGGDYFAGAHRSDDCASPLTNAPYCYATDPRDADATPGVKRACALCGLDAAAELPLPACAELATCVALVRGGTTLSDLHDCAEFVLHGNLHTVLGGAWGCGADLGAAVAARPHWAPVLAPWAARLLAGWQRLVRAGVLARAPNTTAWSCPAYDGTPASARAVLEAGGYASAALDPKTRACRVDSDFVDSAFLAADPPDCVLRLAPDLRENDARDDDAFWVLVADAACSTASLGAMTTAAAPNDPVFWPIHPTFDRLLAYARLAGTLDETWPSSTACEGHGYEDVLPFSHYDFGDSDDAGDLTNAALYAALDPRPVAVDHWTAASPLDAIYDTFDFGHCAAAIEAAVLGDGDATYTLADVPAGKLGG